MERPKKIGMVGKKKGGGRERYIKILSVAHLSDAGSG